MLTQKRLREVLHYDPQTGIFTFVKGRRKGKIAGAQHDARGLLKVSIDNRRYLLHRLAWLWMTGALPRWNVEHINGDRSDNRWANLRQGERDLKLEHRAPLREPTGIKGVWQIEDRFEAMVEIAGVTMNLGGFATAEEAAGAIARVHQRARDRRVKQGPQAA